MGFRDRAEAGRRLAEELAELKGQDVVILGLPRGGCRSPSRWPGPRRAAGRHRRAQARSSLPAGARHGGDRRGWCTGRQRRGVTMTGVDEQEFASVEQAGAASSSSGAPGSSAGVGARFAGRKVRGHRRRRHRHRLDGAGGVPGGPRRRCDARGPRGPGRATASISELAAVADEVVCLETPEAVLRSRPVVPGLLPDGSDKDVIALLHRAARGPSR